MIKYLAVLRAGLMYRVKVSSSLLEVVVVVLDGNVLLLGVGRVEEELHVGAEKWLPTCGCCLFWVFMEWLLVGRPCCWLKDAREESGCCGRISWWVGCMYDDADGGGAVCCCSLALCHLTISCILFSKVVGSWVCWFWFT